MASMFTIPQNVFLEFVLLCLHGTFQPFRQLVVFQQAGNMKGEKQNKAFKYPVNFHMKKNTLANIMAEGKKKYNIIK